MNEHPIEGMMDTTLEKIKAMADANAVVGQPISTENGTVIIPISKVSYGFASGGSDLPSKNAAQKELFGGGAGAGITITPVAFITISDLGTKLLQIDPFHSSLDRVIGMVPDVVEKVSGLIEKRKEKKSEEVTAQKSDLVSEMPQK